MANKQHLGPEAGKREHGALALEDAAAHAELRVRSYEPGGTEEHDELVRLNRDLLERTAGAR